MTSECERRNCSYLWKNENDAYPCCHYNDPIFPAPCEEDDEYYEDWDDDSDAEGDYESEDNLEMGFDPYEGGYTWDC